MNAHKSLPKLDVKAAAQANQTLSGTVLLSDCERLIEETQGLGADHVVSWSAVAQMRDDQAGQVSTWLHLTVDAVLPLVCQRCLSTVDVSVQVDQDYRFVETEALAEEQDDDCEEDLLVISREFDLAALIEDEVLMALPLVPRHEICPVSVKLAAVDADFEDVPAKPSAFAALAKLKGSNSL